MNKKEKKERSGEGWDPEKPSSAALQARLGATYQPEETTFRLWAPSQPEVGLKIYKRASDKEGLFFPMERQGDLFVLSLAGNWEGYYYRYSIQGEEVTDPYSFASSRNSRMSAIVDLRQSDPAGFRTDDFQARPVEQAVIYELQLADYTADVSSGCRWPGKYLALTEEGTRCQGETTGLDHLKELGVSHVHLMPVNDFCLVDEDAAKFHQPGNYNWGYNPQLYNVPEGSYATDPDDPYCRIRELKAMIQSLHRTGIGVILDVVYNHTFLSQDSNFNKIVPGYYYRMVDGHFSNGSGVGNELATEKPMVRKFILDSLLYWQREYRVDGFRFDLMALIDRETVGEAVRLLRENDPRCLIYGEPWQALPSALPAEQETRWPGQNGKAFALFNEGYRSALRGDNDGGGRGFLEGNTAAKEAMEVGILGSISYSEKRQGELDSPLGSINYFGAHDNLILEDKLSWVFGHDQKNEDMTRLAFGILLTSAGIPFFHAGTEFRRSKKMNPNSYNAPPEVNDIHWGDKEASRGLVQYVEELIQLREEYPVLRLPAAQAIRQRVVLLDSQNPNVLSLLYQLEEGSDREWLLVLHSNAWNTNYLPWKMVYKPLRVYEIQAQRIFEKKGRVELNAVSLLEGEGQRMRLEPISTTIYKITKGGLYEL